MAFDGRDRLYVLETSYSTSSPGPVPATGRLIRILPNGRQQVLIDNTLDDPLSFPTGLTFGPDGSLYISNQGFGPPGGEILKVEVKDSRCHDHRVALPPPLRSGWRQPL